MSLHRNFAVVFAAVIMGVAGIAARGEKVAVDATFDIQANQPFCSVTTVLDSPYSHENVYAGVYHFSITGNGVRATSGDISAPNYDPSYATAPTSPVPVSTVSAAFANGFYGVCIDFTHNIGFGQSSKWYVADLTAMGPAANGVGINAPQATAIAYLTNQYFDYVLRPPVSVFDGTQNVSLNSAQYAGAFQMAIWDVVYDGQLDRGLSTLMYDSSNTPEAVTLGNYWASQAEGAGNVGGSGWYVYALIDTDGTQNFNFAVSNASVSGRLPPNQTFVPLPAAAGIGFSMLGGFGTLFGVRKRLKRRARIA